jgi:hypothetical protein
MVGVHIRAPPGAFAEAIRDRVLDLQARVMRMTDRGRAARDLDGKTCPDVEQFRPVDPSRSFIELAGVGHVETGQRQQDAVGQARPQAGAIGDLQRAGKAHAALALGRLRRTECAKLVNQQWFDAPRAGGEQLKMCSGHFGRV